jgi:hypothetical protein
MPRSFDAMADFAIFGRRLLRRELIGGTRKTDEKPDPPRGGLGKIAEPTSRLHG